MSPLPITEAQMLDKNRHFYNSLWGGAQLVEAENFNTWPLVSSLLHARPRRLEVAPGLRPRLPIAQTHFVDISQPALTILQGRGGITSSASICDLPLADQSFDLICALDIIEHVDDDRGALAELSRVAADGALLLISTPLHAELWTAFDDMVGHRRRYQPEAFVALLQQHGFSVIQSAVFGMKPKSSHLVDLGMRLLQRQPKRAFWWYNKIMPLTLRFQKKLTLVPGLLDTRSVSDVFLVCQRRRSDDSLSKGVDK